MQYCLPNSVDGTPYLRLAYIVFSSVQTFVARIFMAKHKQSRECDDEITVQE